MKHDLSLNQTPIENQRKLNLSFNVFDGSTGSGRAILFSGEDRDHGNVQ